MDFDRAVYERRILIENRPDIFGRQQIMDANDQVIDEEPYLLSNATTLSMDEAVALTAQYEGGCYPAHIDREANGIIAILGMLPPEPHFTCAELHDGSREAEFRQAHALTDTMIVVGSDAHYLWDIRDKERVVELDASPEDPDGVRRCLIECMRRNL